MLEAGSVRLGAVFKMFLIIKILHVIVLLHASSLTLQA
jgi:hypothetical protein